MQAPDAAVLGTVPEQLEILARRLDTGWLLIERRFELGEPVEELERHWLRLLVEYESLCSASD
jgi:hypothetical protein